MVAVVVRGKVVASCSRKIRNLLYQFQTSLGEITLSVQFVHVHNYAHIQIDSII